jgi:hypothetical protein
MNPVFLDKLNQVSHDGTQIAYGVPGALPRTPNQPSARVVPPAQPTQVATTQGVAPQVASLEEDAEGTPANVPVPRVAPQAKEGTAPPDQTGLASLIGGMFGSSQSETQAAQPQPAAQPAARPHPTAVAKHTTKPTMQTASAPTPKTAAKKPELRPAVTPEPQVANAKAEPAKEPEMRTAFQTPQPKSTTMSGAQPVVPAGSFESRWSAFRSF